MGLRVSGSGSVYRVGIELNWNLLEILSLSLVISEDE